MKAKLTIIFILLCSTGLHSQSNTDYQKLSKACELWGLIKYFHPDKPGNDFDSAFAANVPNMLSAKNEREWENALTHWLDVLNDVNTKVISDKETKAEEGLYESAFTADSILTIKISGTKLYEDFSAGNRFFETIKAKLKKSKRGIIVDLRETERISSNYEGLLDYYFSKINTELAADIVPQYRTIYYSGFVPEKGITSGGYTINSVVHNVMPPGNFQKQNQKVVWIVNRHSALPIVALSQQASGVGVVISDSENVADLIALSSNFNMSDNLTVNFKTSDIVFQNNFQPTLNYKYAQSENPFEISKKVLANWTTPKNGTLTGVPKPASSGIVSYPPGSYPSVGYRILAAAKIFTVIEKFFPYYTFMDKNWRNVLLESLPEFVNAKDDVEYGFAVAKMYANINDSHGFIQGNNGLAQLRGESVSPVYVDWIENKIVVTQFRNDSLCRVLGINIGDVISKVNGVSVDELMKKYEIYLAHSTKDPVRQTAAQQCIRGRENQEGIFSIQDKNGKVKEVKFKWSNSYNKNFSIKYNLDTIALINEKIGYADLTRMEAGKTDAMFEKFKNTKAIIFDMRGYPKGTAWTITPRLTENKNIPVALFRKNEVLSPNIQSTGILSKKTFTEFVQTVATSDQWKYKGKTIMLINQNAISQSEHTGLFFESANNTTFIGSPTAGANGDVTNFQIPGGMLLSFSGQGVWHVDNRQLQRVGLQPHVLVRPTIKGKRAGKDEVLEKAIEWIDKNVK